MGDKSKICVICKTGATSGKRLLSNASMIKDLLQSCQELVSYGQTDIQPLSDYLFDMNEVELNSVAYHGECRKPLVNRSNIEFLKGKQSQHASSSSSARGVGHPSRSPTTSSRPKRLKTAPKEEACIFSSCDFCSNNESDALHRVYSSNIGEKLLDIKNTTNDDHIRVCAAGDASAQEKYYHKTCMRTAQRISERGLNNENKSLIRSLCDDELIITIQNTLADNVTLNMTQVNDARPEMI